MFRSCLPATFMGGDQKRRNHPLISGILMSVANPYWIIWWATIGLVIFSIHPVWFLGIAFFFAGHILADLVWYSLIAAAVAGAGTF